MSLSHDDVFRMLVRAHGGRATLAELSRNLLVGPDAVRYHMRALVREARVSTEFPPGERAKVYIARSSNQPGDGGLS